MPSAPIDFIVDGSHYDALHGGRSDDVEFFAAYAASRSSVLELGCGTGRVSIPVAATGVPVVGIDLSANFLARAARKAEALGVPAAWHCADVRDFTLARTFDLVIFPFRSVAVLLTDDCLRACVSRARAHLAPDGLFILDAFNTASRAPRPLNGSFSYPDPNSAQTIQVEYERSFNERTGIETGTFRITPPGHERRLELRFHTTADLLAALDSQGFELVEHFGDYQGTPFDGTSAHQVLVCRSR